MILSFRANRIVIHGHQIQVAESYRNKLDPVYGAILYLYLEIKITAEYRTYCVEEDSKYP